MSTPRATPKSWPFRIAVDANELQRHHHGWRFTTINPPVVVIPSDLYVGDYSLVGHEREIIIERKSKPDLYGSLGKNKRENMEERMNLMTFSRYSAMVIEAEFLDCLNNPPPFSKLHPRSVAGTIYAWRQRYKVDWWFAPSAAAAEIITFRLLERFYHEHCDEAVRPGRPRRQSPGLSSKGARAIP